MHRPNLGEELCGMVGKFIYENYNIINHNCRENNVRVGQIDNDIPVEINKHYIDADLKILTGLIEPHPYAGFSGGRKSILPGISSFETMKYMHSFKMIKNVDVPSLSNCNLTGNIFHLSGLKICEKVGVDFIVNVVINNLRQLIGVFSGHYKSACKSIFHCLAASGIFCHIPTYKA